MSTVIELANIHDEFFAGVGFIFEYGGFVVVNVEVIGRREDRDERWESGRATFPVHSITGVLSFVGANHGQ